MGRLYRHGDVLIQQVERLPGGLEKLSHRILAHGEVTGHCHQARGEAELYRSGGELYLRAVGPVEIVHEEHRTIELPSGLYRVWRQREYTPREVRIVRD